MILGRIADVFRIAKIRRAELDKGFLEAQRLLEISGFRSERYRRFADAYLAKLLVVNHSKEAESFIDNLTKSKHAFLMVDDGKYYATYISYLQAVLHNDSEKIAELHGELAKFQIRGLAKSCLPAFPPSSPGR